MKKFKLRKLNKPARIKLFRFLKYKFGVKPNKLLFTTNLTKHLPTNTYTFQHPTFSAKSRILYSDGLRLVGNLPERFSLGSTRNDVYWKFLSTSDGNLVYLTKSQLNVRRPRRKFPRKSFQPYNLNRSIGRLKIRGPRGRLPRVRGKVTVFSTFKKKKLTIFRNVTTFRVRKNLNKSFTKSNLTYISPSLFLNKPGLVSGSRVSDYIYRLNPKSLRRRSKFKRLLGTSRFRPKKFFKPSYLTSDSSFYINKFVVGKYQPFINSTQSKLNNSINLFFNKLRIYQPISTHCLKATPYSNTSYLVNRVLNPFRFNNQTLHNDINYFTDFLSLDFKTVQTKSLPSKPLIFSRRGLPLIFKNLSSFIFTSSLLRTSVEPKPKFVFKKKMFSFIFPNEYKNTLFFKKKKTLTDKLVFNNRFTSTSFKYRRKSIYLRMLYVRSITNLRSPNQNAPYQFNGTSNYSLNLRNRELRIPRVRFRPGYQSLWRKVRSSLKEFMGLRFVYQQQLTRYLAKFYRSANSYLLSRSEVCLYKAILYSHLLPDMSSINTFWANNFIYLNSFTPLNLKLITTPGDIIQLVVSLNYYITYRWLLNLSKKRRNKFRYLVFRKNLSRRYKVIKTRKQSSFYTPNWIYKNRFDFADVKNFIEVDYFSLSAIILYTPYTNSYYYPEEHIDLRMNIFRLYNWKYIT